MKNRKIYLFILALCVMTGLTACRSSYVTVIDAETGRPVPDALVFAYNSEVISLGPRQQLYTTDSEGKAKVYVSGVVTLWAGKTGCYPSWFLPMYSASSFFVPFGQSFPPATMKLHKVKTGGFDEAEKAKKHLGLIFRSHNPPREKDLLKILQYSHWVYMNSEFYRRPSEREILEEFFKKYSFPVKPEK